MGSPPQRNREPVSIPTVGTARKSYRGRMNLPSGKRRRPLKDARANNLTDYQNGEGKQRDNRRVSPSDSGVRSSIGVLA